MRVHAIQTGTVSVTTRQLRGVGGGRTRALRTMFDRNWVEGLPILAWLIEHPDGLIVVDTGESAAAGKPGWAPRWHPYFRLAVRFDVEPEQEIGPQLRAKGFDPEDVKTVVLTHLHCDHADGIPHFPRSEIVVARGEWEAAQGFKGQAGGYLPKHFPQWLRPTLVDGEHTVAEGVRVMPTPGHTPHHQSVVVEDGNRTLFLAGDASYTEELMREGVPDGVTQSPETASQTLARIRALVDERDAVYLPAHDPGSIARLEAA
ncbi:MAG TPA: N-acyl homoserine lactonase family protein [Solirubrobacteraceae bacterium]|nr:N-acyl homoserine lactonase family protein [Solirubrobacteraceae bacterium]